MFKWYGRKSFTPATRIGAFADHLRDGRIMASRCLGCGAQAFPPRADCDVCMHRAFEFVEISGRGHLHTHTRIEAAPTGFEAWAPYRIGVVDLEEGGRILAWFGEGISDDAIAIGMPVQLVPRILDEMEDIHVVCSIEPPGTTWQKHEAGAHAGVSSPGEHRPTPEEPIR